MFVQESSAAASANIHTLKDLNKYKKVYITVSLFCATWKMKKVCIMYKQKNSTLV